MKLLSTLVTAALLSTAITAQANAYDWLNHDALEAGVVLHPATDGAFTDTFSFSLTPSSLLSTSVSNNILDILNITDGKVELYKGDYADGTGDDALQGWYSFDGTTGSSPNLFANLTAGTYYYNVTGVADGKYGGYYTITSAIKAPIPEPETYALMLIGLGATLLARRAKR